MTKEFAKIIYFLLTSLMGSYILAVTLIANTNLDIQLHDTYVVVDRLTVTLLLAIPVILIVFSVKGATENFGVVETNIGIAIGLLLGLYFTIMLTRLWPRALVIVLLEIGLLLWLLVRCFKISR